MIFLNNGSGEERHVERFKLVLEERGRGGTAGSATGGRRADSGAAAEGFLWFIIFFYFD